jgi:hypothetical protein
MVYLVDENGKSVNDVCFKDYWQAYDFLVNVRKCGISNWYLDSGKLNKDNPLPYMFIVIDFADKDNGLYSMVIKAKHYPTPSELLKWIKKDMEIMGYDNIFGYYETDIDDVYEGYDTENISNWPICE